MTIFPIYSVEEARNGILRRAIPDETIVPSHMVERLEQLFGQPTTPAQAVEQILRDVRRQGDMALRQWTETLDGVQMQSFLVSPEEIKVALASLSDQDLSAMQSSIDRVRQFYQRQPLSSWITQDMGGTLGQLIRPIQRVGLYIPAGTAPLPSTVIMSAIPAQVAGVPEIVVVSPPQRGSGKVSPAILAAAALVGVTEVYAMGGAQAIAALAYGTESIPRVDKIFGPGNLFVTLAKKQVYGAVGIDSLAGPTETMIIADELARPAWVAADLLAQAEHDVLASAILLTPSRKLAEMIQEQIEVQSRQLSRQSIFCQSLPAKGGAVITRDLEEAFTLANAFGAEHLCLSVAAPWNWVNKVTSAGGVFLGEHSFEVLGDYNAGPSHVMPTSGSARFASPLNVWDFVRIISLIGLDSTTAASIAPGAARLARLEGLDAHANAAEKRQ